MASHQPISGRAYLLAWIGLLALTGVSLGISYLPSVLPWLLGLAAVKAVVVALVYMHLIEARFASQVVALVTVIFIVILCLGIAADVTMR